MERASPNPVNITKIFFRRPISPLVNGDLPQLPGGSAGGNACVDISSFRHC